MSPQAATTGRLAEKPGDRSPYIVDAHHGGKASEMRLVEMSWGRLVDVHDVDANGVPNATPLFRDLVVKESVISDATGYVLERNPVTARTRLIIRRTFGAPARGGVTFEDLLRAAEGPLAPVQPRALAGTSSLPFSLVPRNACLVLRFDDLLEDSAATARSLEQTLSLHTGYPPTSPFRARVLFDPNHGGVSGGAFHSTRVLVDLTISPAEIAGIATPVPPNPVGLPASIPDAPQANVSLELPFEVDPARGQFLILRNLSGARLASEDNGPIVTTQTPSLQRALRS
ncbi:MAG TPA: hypothetical protein ENJ09_14690, partial [Planctomycetes bacterium]|nr:hypothetical protein [Planctomycetota bacterium]